MRAEYAEDSRDLVLEETVWRALHRLSRPVSASRIRARRALKAATLHDVSKALNWLEARGLVRSEPAMDVTGEPVMLWSVRP